MLNNCENVEPQAEDEDIFYNRFPADTISEVWLSVFDKLEDHHDKITFFRVSSRWHDWVAPKRSLQLLPEITPIILGSLPQEALLESRNLCRTWTTELDSQFQSHPSHLALDFEIDSKEEKRIPPHANRFSTTEQIQAFMEDMESRQDNPFPGRNIHLQCSLPFGYGYDLDLVEREYWRNVSLLLERYGTHILYATISMSLAEVRGVDTLVNFRNYLLNLPNLRRLNITEVCSQGSDQEIAGFFAHNPLPRLQDLETLELNTMKRVIINVIFNSCCVPAKIKSLYYRGFEDYQGLGDKVYDFVNLEELKYVGIGVSTEDFERFRRLPRLPPLRKLSLNIVYAERGTLNLEEILSTLELFGGSLTHLEVTSSDVSRNPVLRPGTRINLPNLKKLYFSLYKGSLGPLLQLTTLTHLSITTSRKDEEWDGALVQFYGYEDRMNESYIWGLMSSLQRISLGYKIYVRPIYKQTPAGRKMARVKRRVTGNRV